MREYYCDLCKKEIKKEEATESCVKMCKAMKDDPKDLFKLWFNDYCKECADKYIKGEIKEL